MKTTPDNALSPEERDLARLISRQGPHGEPSAALDSRILGAAHAAVARHAARKPKPRWPVALGLAASVVFAVGIAWQLRPLQEAASVSEAPVAYSRAEPPAAASDAAAIAGPGEEEALNAVAVAESAAGAAASPAMAPPFSRPAPPEPLPMPAAPRTPPPQPFAKATRPGALPAPPQSRDRYSTPSPPPSAPPATSAAPSEPSPAFVADMQADTASTRQEAAAVHGAMRSSNATTAKQSAPRDDARAAAREIESRELDQVEVTGSRLRRTDLQVPVSEDAQLAVEDWLERVRTRYGLGDAGAAKKSLLLFVKDHPEEPIPGDLEPLLDE